MNWSQLIINILVIGGLGSIVLYYVVKFFLGESEYKKSALITFTVAIVGYLIQSLQYQIMGMVAFFVVVLVSFFMLKQIY